MHIDDLATILLPPSSPKESQGTWSEVEKQIGTRLPQDYMGFIERYGTGSINRFIWVFNPFTVNQYLNLGRQIVVRLGVLETLARDAGMECPYPLFPQKGGLMPFAGTDNGDVVYWITEGDPNAWRVTVNEARGPRFQEFSLSATDFLAGILTGQVNCTLFPPDLREDRAFFERATGKRRRW